MSSSAPNVWFGLKCLVWLKMSGLATAELQICRLAQLQICARSDCPCLLPLRSESLVALGGTAFQSSVFPYLNTDYYFFICKSEPRGSDCRAQIRMGDSQQPG